MRQLAPDAVVLAAIDASRFDAIAGPLRELSGEATIWLAGSGAGKELAAQVGATDLRAGPVEAAAAVASPEPPS